MGAGTDKDHFIQDAGELYFVYKMQKMAVDHGLAITPDYDTKYEDFIKHCNHPARRVLDDFNNSLYRDSIDKVVPHFCEDLVGKFPNQKFDIQNREVENRNQKKKGDFAIIFDDGNEVSFSLKNYKKSINRIQLCSGTWNSMLMNLLFVSEGVGRHRDPFTNEIFSGSNRDHRNALIEKMGYTSDVLDAFYLCDMVLDTIKQKYVFSDEGRYWSNAKSEWESDCKVLSQQAINSTIHALRSLPNEIVLRRIIEMAGLDNSEDSEELLVIGRKGKSVKYICSLFDQKFYDLLRRVNSDDVMVEYFAKGKSIVFALKDRGGTVVEVEVPYTLQKNGAWYLPKQPYSGKIFHEKEGIDLSYGERRPQKSRELNTSTNTYLGLKKLGLEGKDAV